MARSAKSTVGDAADIVLDGVAYCYLLLPLPEAKRLSGLTEAEQAVVRGVERGWSNKQIAEARGSRARTIANQLASVYRKLGVGSRFDLIRILVEEGDDRE